MEVEAITYSESDFLNDSFVLQGMRDIQLKPFIGQMFLRSISDIRNCMEITFAVFSLMYFSMMPTLVN